MSGPTRQDSPATSGVADCSGAAIAALERLAAINLTMSLYAMQRGDTHGAMELRREASRINTLIAEIGSRQSVEVWQKQGVPDAATPKTSPP